MSEAMRASGQPPWYRSRAEIWVTGSATFVALVDFPSKIKRGKMKIRRDFIVSVQQRTSMTKDVFVDRSDSLQKDNGGCTRSIQCC